jgi:hypothetical protein
MRVWTFGMGGKPIRRRARAVEARFVEMVRVTMPLPFFTPSPSRA